MSSSKPWKMSAAVVPIALLALAAAVAPAHAAVFVPTKTVDSADGACNTDCSLREAVLAANASPGSDVILLGPGEHTLCQALQLGDDLVLYGASAESTILTGCRNDRILDVPAGARVEVHNVTIRNGLGPIAGGGIRNAGTLILSRSIVTGNAAPQGGGIWTGGNGSSLTISQSTISNNAAFHTGNEKGGGLLVDGTLRVTNSTISGNRATDGGGIYFLADADADLVNVTITGNTAERTGGGIVAESVPFGSRDFPELRSSILAGNTAPTDRDCSGSVVSGGDNLIGDGTTCIDFSPAKGDQEGTAAAPLNPRLAPLAGNGGPTPTHALLAGSPALNAGGACEATDQRGQPRDANCDTGAFEQGNACVQGGPNLCLSGDRFRVTVQWRNGAGDTGSGQAVRLTPDTGYFWFFGPTNVELTVKVLNGCSLNNRYWVFLSGMTNVQVTVTVTDTRTGQTKTYQNPLNTTFRTRLDTNAFATCNYTEP